MRRRGEMVERSFAHVLDRGGMRRALLRERKNVHKRYLIHVAGFNLGILMRAAVRIRHAEGGCECKEHHFVRYSVRCCPGDRHRGEHRRQTSNARYHRRPRNRLINERLHHRAVNQAAKLSDKPRPPQDRLAAPTRATRRTERSPRPSPHHRTLTLEEAVREEGYDKGALECAGIIMNPLSFCLRTYDHDNIIIRKNL